LPSVNTQFTRRELAGAALAGTVAAQVPHAPPAGAETELEAARRQNQRMAEALAGVPIAMDTEPAFRFTP
jgi:hypothetical protein